MGNLQRHLHTVHIHRKYVRQACFKMGIPMQGLLHDLSKYSPAELKIAKYYNGIESPHAVCRRENGYSPCWMHHYHKNKHHWEYWLDMRSAGRFIPMKMPYKYMIESVCDMIGASKAYAAGSHKIWSPSMPIDYWKSARKEEDPMHEGTKKFLRMFLEELNTRGEKNFYKWYKENQTQLKAEYEKLRNY